ncbi:hypothetical protein [Peribacillus loiseleuriae]|uniref:Uncharacterized protein n=1 Tax=Peribacillus loiseleuriae TaxID=1679170 RepID=A0A0K9GUX9_9BACI|nr:hypothetical protein [Peribacillus loiseleuriae]KMY50465.1 hypothetical protein AC625_13940 [Peribacillus loiseleuriae]
MNEENAKNLLRIYSKLWKNRVVEERGDKDDDFLLREKIKAELLDENSHPRARKNRYEKFYLCLQRVQYSKLNDEEKSIMLSVYIEEMEKLQTPL